MSTLTHGSTAQLFGAQRPCLRPEVHALTSYRPIVTLLVQIDYDAQFSEAIRMCGFQKVHGYVTFINFCTNKTGVIPVHATVVEITQNMPDGKLRDDLSREAHIPADIFVMLAAVASSPRILETGTPMLSLSRHYNVGGFLGYPACRTNELTERVLDLEYYNRSFWPAGTRLIVKPRD